jgi:hypothetical protein
MHGIPQIKNDEELVQKYVTDTLTVLARRPPCRFLLGGVLVVALGTWSPSANGDHVENAIVATVTLFGVPHPLGRNLSLPFLWIIGGAHAW